MNKEGSRQSEWGSGKVFQLNVRCSNECIELYDLCKDMGEQNNVDLKFPKLVQEIGQLMAQARSPYPGFPLLPRDPLTYSPLC